MRIGKPASRRIVAAGVPGIAAADSPDAAARPANRPVLPHRLDEIDAATRLEAAATPAAGQTSQQRTEANLVEPNQCRSAAGRRESSRIMRSRSPVTMLHCRQRVHRPSPALCFELSLQPPGQPHQRFQQRASGGSAAARGITIRSTPARQLRRGSAGTPRAAAASSGCGPPRAELPRNRDAQPRMRQPVGMAEHHDQRRRPRCTPAAVRPLEVAGRGGSRYSRRGIAGRPSAILPPQVAAGILGVMLVDLRGSPGGRRR